MNSIQDLIDFIEEHAFDSLRADYLWAICQARYGLQIAQQALQDEKKRQVVPDPQPQEKNAPKGV